MDDSNTVFTISQKYIFIVHQITTLGDKFNTLWRGHGQKPLRMYQNMSFQVHVFLERGLAPSPYLSIDGRGTPPPVEKGGPSPHCTPCSHQAFWICPSVHRQNSSQIYAIDCTTVFYNAQAC